MKKLFIILSLLLFTQISAFAATSPTLDAGNFIQIISNASQYSRIQGTISNIDVSDKSNTVLLNFGQNFNTSFSAIIHDDVIPFFAMNGITEPAEYFKNKTVILEGIIRISNGKPEMVIDSPSQIKLVNNI